jgi:hypothetical protein
VGARNPIRALKSRVIRSNARFAAFARLLPLIPPTPFSHKGRRGSLGILMPETEDGTQGLPQKPAHVSLSGCCLDRHCHGFTATQAKCSNAAPAAATQQGVDERHQNTRAAGANRVPQGDCAAVPAG